MRYLLAGPDDFSLKAKLNSIKASLGDPSILGSATSEFDGAKVKTGEFKLTVDALPFLTPCRLIVVSGLLARFQTSAEVSTRKAPRPEEAMAFASAINSSPPSTVLILLENTLNRSNPLFKEIAGDLEVHEFPLFDKPQLKEWIGRRVMTAGGSISPGAINLLVQYVGPDLWAAAGEIDKLVLYAGGRTVTETDVKALVGYAQEASIFNLVDSIFDGRLKSATESLESLKMGGLSASYVLSMLARQLRLVIQVVDLKSRGENDVETRRKLGLTADFVWKKTRDQAARFTLSRLKDIFSRLLEADLAAKTGLMDESLAVDLLVAELASGAALSSSTP